MSIDRAMSRWRLGVIVGLVLIACGALGASAAADGGHLPGFSVADKRVAITKLPEAIRFSFMRIPGEKGTRLPQVGHGPVWFGEVERPKGTIYVAGNERWVCLSEARVGESGGSSSCTAPAAAREFGLLDVSACGKGPPRHFRVVALMPDGVDAVELEKAGGKIGRTVPAIENTLAFTIGRENVVLHGTGDSAAEALERGLPLAQAAKLLPGKGGCASYIFAEARRSSGAERAP